jgi:hypothetical protein
MHIAISHNITSKSIGAVAFDFEGVLEPHEHLQRSMLIFSGKHDTAGVFADWAGRNIGKRHFVWTREPSVDQREFDNMLLNNGVTFQKLPWTPTQASSLHTLVWAASHVLGSEFKVPSIETAGLDASTPLHDAALSATLAQAALRALILHERRHGPGKSTYPKALKETKF